MTLNIYASRYGVLGRTVLLICPHPSSSRTSAQWRMVNSLLLATFIRTLLVIVSYGCKVPAGIFVPSMAIGATFGRMVGIIVKALYRFVVFLHRRNQSDFLRVIGRTLLLACSTSVSLMSHA